MGGMGASLGEFGAELAALDDDGGPDTFLFHGHEFTLPAKVSSLPALRFAYNAKQVEVAEQQATAKAQRARGDDAKADAARAMGEVELMASAGLYAYLRDVLPNEWARFEEVAAQVGADEAELLDVAQKIMSAVASRPTRRSAGSPAGPSTTGGSSTAGSASPPASTPAPEPAQEQGPVPVRPSPMWVEPPAEQTEPEGPTPLDLARQEIRESSRSVGSLVRSGR